MAIYLSLYIFFAAILSSRPSQTELVLFGEFDRTRVASFSARHPTKTHLPGIARPQRRRVWMVGVCLVAETLVIVSSFFFFPDQIAGRENVRPENHHPPARTRYQRKSTCRPRDWTSRAAHSIHEFS